MKLRVAFFNDKTKAQHVYLDTFVEYRTVFPQEMIIFEFHAPEGSIPWIKQWDTYTLISHCKEENLHGKVETVHSTGSGNNGT